MKKFLASLVSAVMLVSVLAACGGDTSSTAEPAADEGTTESVAADDNAEEVEADVEEGEASGDAEYAVILKTQASDFWITMKEGIEAKAAELGITVDIYAAQNEEDTEGQLQILENCLTKNYKAIGIAPLSPVNLISGIVRANEMGIYVMNIDEQVEMETLMAQGGSVIAFATTDNVAVGANGAGAIIDANPGGGQVAIIEGKAGNTSGEDRKDGATQAFEDAGFEIVGSLPGDWDRQTALDVATSFIQSNPDLVGIYCCNDTMALGAYQAVLNAGKEGEIAVVGTDGDTEALESVAAGQMYATVAQDPAAIGATSLEIMIQAVTEGWEIDPAAEPVLYPIESNLITK